jgi:AcrR family transcriptional regulator
MMNPPATMASWRPLLLDEFIKTLCCYQCKVSSLSQCVYDEVVPKLWSDTVDEHRRVVREAVIDATARLVAEHGVASVTMSQIAAETGIGRATLYKYFPDIEAILIAWHERQVSAHLDQLTHISSQPGSPGQLLEAALYAYARIVRARPHGTNLSALLHKGEHVAQAHERLTGLIEGLLTQAARNGEVRDDVAPGELAGYCVHALGAAASTRSEAAVRRLVAVTYAGLCPPR